MKQNLLFTKLEAGLRILSGLALALILFQGIGVLTYILTVWPSMSGGLSTAITILVILAVTAALVRSSLWIGIYWNGARVVSTLRVDGQSNELSEKLVPILATETRLLVTSSVLDVLLLPVLPMARNRVIVGKRAG